MNQRAWYFERRVCDQITYLGLHKAQALTAVCAELLPHPNVAGVKHSGIKVPPEDFADRVGMRMIGQRRRTVDVGETGFDRPSSEFSVFAQNQIAARPTKAEQCRSAISSEGIGAEED